MSSTTSGQLSLTLLQQQRLQQSMMLLNSARQLVQSQNLPEALNAVERALQAVPSNMDALILKGQILGAGGRYQEAMVVVDKALAMDANNALVWSMRAALLLNTGRVQEALPTIERSLALDPNNPETRTMKAAIEERLANQHYVRNYQNPQRGITTSGNRDTLKSFLIGGIIQLLGLMMGTVGAALLILKPQLPILLAFTLISLGLAILCVNAARGSYRYGATRVISTLLLCLVAAGLIGAIYKFGYNWLLTRVQANPPLLVSILFLALWLVLAAALPLLAAFGGFITGIAKGMRKQAGMPSTSYRSPLR
jgi:tetratricopeptide (TPR) repeat protein